MALVDVFLQNAVGTLTLNDPAKRNALSSQLIDELVAGFAIGKVVREAARILPL